MPTFLDPPIEGAWPHASFPELVTIDGRTFARARWKQDREGVLEQYREAVPEHSMHLLVLGPRREVLGPDPDSGPSAQRLAPMTYLIEHVDDLNPDADPVRAVGHFLTDYGPGRAARALGLAAILTLGVFVVGSVVRS